MNRLMTGFVLLFGCVTLAAAQTPSKLTTLHAVHALTNAEAGKHIPAVFEATVTYFDGSGLNSLFVQEGSDAIWVRAIAGINLTPGDRILVKGITRPSFHPVVDSSEIKILGHGSPPVAAPATFDQLIHAQFDGQLVVVRATVRSAYLIYRKTGRFTYLHLLVDGNSIDATVKNDDESLLKNLLDAEVELTGVAAGRFDGKMQMTGVLIHASSMSDIAILKPADVSSWTLPITTMDKIVSGYNVRNLTKRIRIHGTVTYYQPGAAIVLEDNIRSVWIATRMSAPLQIGDLADATGFPDIHDDFLTLVDGEVLDSRIPAPIAPQAATWQSLATNDNITLGHTYDLVTIEGEVRTEAREAGRDEYVISSDGRLFTAIYYHTENVTQIPLPPMREVPLGSRVRITGICFPTSSNGRNGPIPFDILLRSFDDIVVVSKPSLVTVRNLVLTVSLLLLFAAAVVVWGGLLRLKVRRQTAQLTGHIEAEAALERRMALLEQRRSSILESIIAAEPLADILEEVASLVSFVLSGAIGWCEIDKGARLGTYPTELNSLRIVSEVIPSRLGPSLGTIYAGIDSQLEVSSAERNALTVGAQAAALAIETHKLYSDLHYRSDFDQLTGVHNRFSLERNMNAQLVEARRHASVFGLIYIDLDGFKQVNDLHGHHVGDLYLQHVARRLTDQLRPHDFLARLGGDEFAVLLPDVCNFASARDVVIRLDHCFDDVFAIEEYLIHGSASFGVALYPESGTAIDSLLSVADSAMYRAKEAKREGPVLKTVRPAKAG
jgi:diguanylate cyclase (GGDEF)-like protein